MSGIQGAYAFMRSSAVATYKYMGQNGTDAVRGGATVAGMTSISVQPTAVSPKAIGLVVDGTFIAQASNQYSTNNGASWTSWTSPGSYTASTMPTGLNGGIAYNPTAKRAMSFFTEYDAKGNTFYSIPKSVTSAGVVTTASGPSLGPSSTTTKNIIYSSALNYFFIMNYGSSATACWAIDGTSGTGGATASGSSNGNYVAGVSSDGYPIQAAFQGGATFNLRKYTAADFSTYTDYGAISAAAANSTIQSPFFWAPVNNQYYHAGIPSSSGTISIQYATAASPHSYTSLATISLSALSTASANFIEQSDGTLWIFGSYLYDAGSSGILSASYTYYSTDAGTTWTSTTGTAVLALAKNFTP